MQKRRILIVDNNDELRVLLAGVLGKLGHDVVAIGDRETALARADLETFDLIISDLTEEASSNGNPVSELTETFANATAGRGRSGRRDQGFQDGSGKLPAVCLQKESCAR